MAPAVRRVRVDDAAAFSMLLACVAFFARRALHGMHYVTFGDETMHFIGAKALLSGAILYRDFIELHGPLAYALPQAYFALFGWDEPLRARAILVWLTVLATLAVGSSSSLQGAWERMVAASLFLGLTTTLWIVQGLCLYDYQPPAGMLLTIAAVLAMIPSWFDDVPSQLLMFVAGFCLALTPFLAFSYGPPALLFFASIVWALSNGRLWRQIRTISAGAAVGTILMLCWITRYADLRGYVVFHFIHALVDFGPYLHYGIMPSLTILRIRASPEYLPQTAGVIGVALACALFLACGVGFTRHRMPALLGLLGIITTNSRGSAGFQDAAFILISFGSLSLALAFLARRIGLKPRPSARACTMGMSILAIVIAELAARSATSSPHGFSLRQRRDQSPASLAQSELPWAKNTRIVTAPNEPILVLPFEPDIYARAGRLPMARYIYYLPWDADYARRPWFGIQRDICLDIAREMPPMIYYNGWVVWDKWDPKTYMACLMPILATQYRPMPGETDFYVRLDRIKLLTP